MRKWMVCCLAWLMIANFLFAVLPEKQLQKIAKQNKKQENTPEKFNILYHKYRNYLLTLQSFRNPNEFILKLKTQQTNVSSALYYLLSTETQKAINDYRDANLEQSIAENEDENTPVSPMTLALLKDILNDLNPILVEQAIFISNTLQQLDPNNPEIQKMTKEQLLLTQLLTENVKEEYIKLDPPLSNDTISLLLWYRDMKKAHQTVPMNEQVVRLNRLLLEEAYPADIIKLRRTIENPRGILAYAQSTTLDETSAEDEHERFLALYEGKTFDQPLKTSPIFSTAGNESDSNNVAPITPENTPQNIPTTPETSNNEDDNETLLMMLGGILILAGGVWLYTKRSRA